MFTQEPRPGNIWPPPPTSALKHYALHCSVLHPGPQSTPHRLVIIIDHHDDEGADHGGSRPQQQPAVAAAGRAVIDLCDSDGSDGFYDSDG